LFANIKHVSSANSVVLKLDTFGKSLTYSEKRKVYGELFPTFAHFSNN